MIDAQHFAGRLVDAGLDDAERTRKEALFQRVWDRWGRLRHHDQATAWWVPGRLEVFGTHTDYAGGRALVAAVPRGFAFLAARRTDRRVTMADAGHAGDDDRVVVEPGASTLFRGWRHYVEVTAGRLARNFPAADLGVDIVFASDLPRAAGMSSSSALVVGTATALIHAGRLREREEWQQNVRSKVDEAGYLACIENGRTFGTLAGDAGVGTHGGSEDHAALLAGSARGCSAFAFVPLRQLETIAMPPRWSVVVATSGIGSHKTGTERDAYNHLSEGTRVLLELWNAAHAAPSSSLASALASAPGALDELQAHIRSATMPGWSAARLGDRLTHFAREDARVGAAMGALRAADSHEFGRAAAASQADGERILANQVPETVALARAAREAGAFAARGFGAGFGGSVWAMVEGDPGGFAGRWLAGYRAECPEAGERAVAFAANPGPPVTQVD